MAEHNLYLDLTDHSGTPRKIMNPRGFTVWDWDAKEPFGNESPNQNPSSLGVFEFNSRLPGQWFDQETGLHHNGFRDYHPGLGRYVQSDPLGLEAGWNTYGYVGGNPVAGIDPKGLIITVFLDIRDPYAGGYIEGVKRTNQAVKTLMTTVPGFKNKWDLMQSDKSVLYTIYLNNEYNVKGANEARFDPKITGIFWNPDAGFDMKNSCGGFLVPAAVLGHEFEHAWDSYSGIPYMVKINEKNVIMRSDTYMMKRFEGMTNNGLPRNHSIEAVIYHAGGVFGRPSK